MKSAYVQSITIAVIAILVLSLVPLSRAQIQTQDYTVSFQLLNHPDGDKTYELNVTISQALYQHYLSKSHYMYSDKDFAKFVTPYALKPIADKLWQIYNNTEDFTNGVLMLVHQITYQATDTEYFPVETLAAGKGDCDLFAFIAASILEAGGVNTVLLYYQNLHHMEIGVNLDKAPVDAVTQVFSVNYQNAPYYIAECTGQPWRQSWRVGQSPTDYQNASVQIIPLTTMEQTSTGQVSATLKELDPSTVTLQVSPSFSLENSQITIRGQILPQVANENVTLQAKIFSSAWTTIGTVETQADGHFEYKWIAQTVGVIPFQALWLGNRQYNGATSSETTAIIAPLYVVAMVVAVVLAVIIIALVFFKTRPKKQEPPAPSTIQDAAGKVA